MLVRLATIGSSPFSSVVAEEGVEERRSDGKDGCHPAHNMNVPHGPNRTLQCASECQHALIKDQI